MSDYEELGAVPTDPKSSEPVASGDHQCAFNEAALQGLEDKIAGLQDLFVRRLSEDKQKTELIRALEAGANFAFIEPFLSDILLLLDRLDKNEDDFVKSIKEELLDIIGRRGVKKIKVTSQFDPSLNKAVKVVEEDDIDKMRITRIIRNGYTYSGKVIRAAEVVVAKPKQQGMKGE